MPHSGAPLGRVRILLVEDSELDAELLIEQLLEAGPARAQQNYAVDRSPSSAPGAGVKETIEDPWQDLGDD